MAVGSGAAVGGSIVSSGGGNPASSSALFSLFSMTRAAVAVPISSVGAAGIAVPGNWSSNPEQLARNKVTKRKANVLAKGCFLHCFTKVRGRNIGIIRKSLNGKSGHFPDV